MLARALAPLLLGLVLTAGPAVAATSPSPAPSAQALPSLPAPSDEPTEEPGDEPSPPPAPSPEPPEPQEPQQPEEPEEPAPAPVPAPQEPEPEPEPVEQEPAPSPEDAPTTSPTPSATASSPGPLLTGFIPPGPVTAAPQRLTASPSASPAAVARRSTTDPITRGLRYALVGGVLLGLAGGTGLYLTRERP